MKKLIFIILLSATVISAQSRDLTLKESLKVGLEKSKSIKISKSKLISSKEKVFELKSQMLPILSFAAGYARLSSIPSFEVTVPFLATPITLQDPVLNTYGVQLSVKQALFTGFRLSSLKKAAEFNSLALENEYQKEINEDALKIHTAFWNYYKAKEISKLIEENLKSIKNHLEDTKNFLKNGLVTKNDLLKLEVQYSNIKLKLIEANNNVELTKAAFNISIGLKLDEQTRIKVDDISIKPIIEDYEVLLDEALLKREEIKAAFNKIKAGEEGISVSRSGWFPQLFLFGNFYYSRPNPRILPLEDKFNDTWDVGVSLNWNLWDWGNTSSKTEQAKQKILQVETAYQLIKETIELEVYKNYLKLISEIKKVDVSRMTVISAEENYRITKDKYNNQIVTSSELIDAEVYLLEAKTNLSTALVNYEIAKVTLEKSLGRKIY